MDSVAILDFGSQYTQLIARRVREARVYSEIFQPDSPAERVLALPPRGFILSGGPASVYDPEAPRIPPYVIETGLPILGICYGMQALAQELGGRVAASSRREYGPAEIEVVHENPILPPGQRRVWMSHTDRIEDLPPGFVCLARSANSPIAAIADERRRLFGLQFHPEVAHTPDGSSILSAFLLGVCRARPQWTPAAMVATALERVRAQVDDGRALAAVSGGVDSLVAAALAGRAIADRLACVFVDTGLLRHDEPEEVARAMADVVPALISVDARDRFLRALSGVLDPEAKRRVIGEQFVRVFQEQAARLGGRRHLVQGTIYPDVIESRAADGRLADRIKTHHNVGGLPPDHGFELVEPLRHLFKDEVRAVGETLGLPARLVWRQPFPGPGLAVRCLGEVTSTRLEMLRAADHIFLQELESAGELTGSRDAGDGRGAAQAFAVLLPVRSVGVMGDQRSYAEVVALRAVTTQDYMTADWTRLAPELLAKVAGRIVNEVAGVNRVVYDITSKPPATIEWE